MENKEEINAKKKKKAFTLIELLAIIVILAIIAVITVPIILNIIDNSRKGAVQDSAFGYKDAISKFYVTKLSKDSAYKIPNGTYTVNGTNGYLVGTETLEIEVSGQKPNSGAVEIENNNVKQACLKFGDYAVTITDGSVGTAQKASCNGTILGESGGNDTPNTNIAANTIISKSITESALNNYSDKSTVKVPVTVNHPAVTENTATGSTIPALTSYTYMGADPDNYIYFNCDTYEESEQNSQTCEMWRIISVENNKLKITTADSIGSMPWDEGYVNHGSDFDNGQYNYKNDWATSDLNDFLNGKYLNNGVAINYTKDGKEISIPARTYFDRFNYTISASGSGSGSGTGSGASLGKRYSYLNQTTSSLISNTIWYLGGGTDNRITPAQAYAMERGNEKYTGDDITRTTSVNSKVAIMSLSDYTFASSACYNGTTELYNYNNCTSSNWLYNGNYQCLLSPSSDDSSNVWYVVDDLGYADHSDVSNTYGVRPVVYLNSNIGLSGSGTSSDPYKIIR